MFIILDTGTEAALLHEAADMALGMRPALKTGSWDLRADH